MKKLFSVILSFVVLSTIGCLSSQAAIINKQINANIKTKRVPSGTIIKLKVFRQTN